MKITKITMIIIKISKKKMKTDRKKIKKITIDSHYNLTGYSTY